MNSSTPNSTNNKKKLPRHTWWICGAMTIVFILSSDGSFEIALFLGLANGIFWGLILAYIIEKLSLALRNLRWSQSSGCIKRPDGSWTHDYEIIYSKLVYSDNKNSDFNMGYQCKKCRKKVFQQETDYHR